MLAKKYPVINLLGPRQARKTAFAKKSFPNKSYLNRGNAGIRALAVQIRKVFAYPDGAVLDELQRAYCYLLSIETVEGLYGNIFENWVIIEMMKARYNKALDPHFYFYRDRAEKEVDLLIQNYGFRQK